MRELLGRSDVPRRDYGHAKAASTSRTVDATESAVVSPVLWSVTNAGGVE